MLSLFELLRDAIRARGPMPFEAWMGHALYHPTLGYYRRAPLVTIGRGGDFYTNVSVSSLYGRLLAGAWAEAWEKLGRPQPFWILEQGAHNGQLAADILTALAQDAPDCFAAARYGLIEPGDAVVARQAQGVTLEAAGLLGKASWTDPAAASGRVDSRPGVFFCHELVDSFPVHRIRRRAGFWMELYVDWQDGRFVWLEGPPTSPLLVQELGRLGPLLPLVEGYTTEICTQIRPWMESAAALLGRGFWTVIDYGLPRERYYEPARTDGTLRAYLDHQALPDPLALPLDRIGQFDMTTHVEWTALGQAAEAAGLTQIELVDQERYLMRRAAPLLTQHESHVDAAALKTLVHPEMMGARFSYWVGEKREAG